MPGIQSLEIRTEGMPSLEKLIPAIAAGYRKFIENN